MPVQQSLPAADILNFETQRIGARSTASQGLARNTFDLGMLNLQNRRNVSNISRSFGRSRQRVPEQFTRRGLLRSGLFNRAREDINVDEQRSLDDTAFSFNRQRGSLGLQSQGIEAALSQALSQIDVNQLVRRSLLASGGS